MSLQTHFFECNPETSEMWHTVRGKRIQSLCHVDGTFIGRLWIDDELLYVNEGYRQQMDEYAAEQAYRQRAVAEQVLRSLSN